MLPLPGFLHEDDGGLSVWSLAVFLVVILSILFLRPFPPPEATLKESLGGHVVVERI